MLNACHIQNEMAKKMNDKVFQFESLVENILRLTVAIILFTGVVAGFVTEVGVTEFNGSSNIFSI
jgi:hypothetical protein